MKKIIIVYASRIVAVLSLLLVTSGVVAYPGGSPAGYTGSPGDGHHCQSCHGGSVATVSGWITSNIPSGGYTAGSTYTLTVTVSGTGKKGFEVSPQNVTGTQLGVFAAGTGNHLVGGTKYVTQNASGSSSGTATWSFSWTAPPAGTGDVTFYGAFTVGKTDTKLSTLTVGESTALPLAATASAVPSLICAGQDSQLEASATGGTGNYTYAWTSQPAGFTSASPNPVVTPAVTTTYTVVVSDGNGSVNADIAVTVNEAATAAAGEDVTLPYVTVSVPLDGTAGGYSSVLWSTSGTGTFSNAGALTGDYILSDADRNAGSVTLTLTANPQSPCTTPAVSSRVIHIEGPVGMEDPGSFSFTVSPNPCTDRFSVGYDGVCGPGLQITLTDLCGKTLERKEVAGRSGQVGFELHGVPSGVYLLKLETSGISRVRKLVIR